MPRLATVTRRTEVTCWTSETAPERMTQKRSAVPPAVEDPGVLREGHLTGQCHQMLTLGRGKRGQQFRRFGHGPELLADDR